MKLKDAHIFSNEEGSIAKFFVTIAIFLVANLTAEFISSVYREVPFKWETSLVGTLVFAAILTIIYFISRLLAYRTKIFPKTKNREGIHGVCFIFLLLVSFILVFVII